MTHASWKGHPVLQIFPSVDPLLEHTIFSQSMLPGHPIFCAGCNESRYKDQPGWEPTRCTIENCSLLAPKKWWNMIQAKRQWYDQQKQHGSHPILGSDIIIVTGCEDPPLVSPTRDISTSGGKTMTKQVTSLAPGKVVVWGKCPLPWWSKGISTDMWSKHAWIDIWEWFVVSSWFSGPGNWFLLASVISGDTACPHTPIIVSKGLGTRSKLRFWSQKRPCSLDSRGGSDSWWWLCT